MRSLIPFKSDILKEGYAEIHARPEKRFYNPMQVMHGGWFMTMLDTAIAAQTTLQPGETYTSYEAPVQFSRALTEEDKEGLITGRLVDRGRTLIALEGTITLPNGKLCAHGTSTCTVLKARTNAVQPSASEP